MTFYQKFREFAVAGAAVSALTLGGGAALAQPAPGMHGHGPHGADIGQLIAHAKSQLNLNTMQSGLFDAAVAAGKSARQSTAASRQNVKAVLTAELAKPEPNLRAVAAAADSARSAAEAARSQVREKWFQLYDTFTPDQKGVVKTLIQNRMARTEQFRQKMIERMQQRSGGTTG